MGAVPACAGQDPSESRKDVVPVSQLGTHQPCLICEIPISWLFCSLFFFLLCIIWALFCCCFHFQWSLKTKKNKKKQRNKKLMWNRAPCACKHRYFHQHQWHFAWHDSWLGRGRVQERCHGWFTGCRLDPCLTESLSTLLAVLWTRSQENKRLPLHHLFSRRGSDVHSMASGPAPCSLGTVTKTQSKTQRWVIRNS